jgi:hypothetical protein
VAIVLKVVLVSAMAYGILVLLAWGFQEQIAFPAPRGPLPHPRERGIPDGERVSLVTADGVTLHGWYLPPVPRPAAGGQAAALLWFYGNAETVSDVAPLVRDLRPLGIAVLIVDYRGYGESAGRASERGLYLDADAAWEFLATRPDLAAHRIGVYGRSLGSAPALHLATTHAVRAVVLEAPFTSARAMAREHYRIIPPFLLRITMDNLHRARQLDAPLLVIHGTADRVVPFAMGRAIAAAGRGTLVAVDGADHNETYYAAAPRYRDEFRSFLAAHLQ